MDAPLHNLLVARSRNEMATAQIPIAKAVKVQMFSDFSPLGLFQ